MSNNVKWGAISEFASGLSKSTRKWQKKLICICRLLFLVSQKQTQSRRNKFCTCTTKRRFHRNNNIQCRNGSYVVVVPHCLKQQAARELQEHHRLFITSMQHFCQDILCHPSGSVTLKYSESGRNSPYAIGVGLGILSRAEFTLTGVLGQFDNITQNSESPIVT